MLHPGGSRRRITRTLNAAYAGGLLSEDTFAARLDQVLKARLVDPFALVGDLDVRRESRLWTRFQIRTRAWIDLLLKGLVEGGPAPVLLALDWSGTESELLIGRHPACDVVLEDLSVSRRHARLVFRDARWIVQDLNSTNGTALNGRPVGRCELRPGDSLVLGEQRLEID